MEEVLRLEGISKSFPGVRALDDISCSIHGGEVLSVIGENGAGKSTLMKILSGVHEMDSGKIFMHGEEVVFHNPQESLAHGVSIIYQELSQMPNLSIAENIFAGRAKHKGILYDRKHTEEEAQKVLARVGLDVKSSTLISRLSIAQRQMVELAKAISFDAKVIIMDEPTSSLTESEINILMDIIDQLRREGLAILFISHKLDEVLRISDRVMVLRDGRHIDTFDRSECTESRLINAIVGRDLTELYPKITVPIGKTIMKVENLNAVGSPIKNISFEVRAGEILGIYGLVGAGRSETANAIFGIDELASGSITVGDAVLKKHKPTDSIAAGIGYVPEDRKQTGLVLGMTVRENTTLANLKAVSRRGQILRKLERKIAQEYSEKLHVKTPSIEQHANNLSGGNQQKVVLSKWLLASPKVLILDEPTRGIDIGAKREIFVLVEEMVSQGMGVVMISSELSEILGMADRILVMHEGAIVGELPREEASQRAIMEMIFTRANGSEGEAS